MDELLGGIKVLDLTTDVAGCGAAALMTDYGAEAIKIERPGIGDANRAAYPLVEGGSLAHCWLNRGKKSVELDIYDEQAVEIIIQMAKTADVIFESGKPGELAKLGLGYEREMPPILGPVLKLVNAGIRQGNP